MSWQQDVAFIRDWNKKGGVREVALRYNRVVAQVGKRKCAAEVGCSVTTVGRYTKTWDALADAGLVAHVKDLKATTSYDFDAVGVTEDVWDEAYEAARYVRKDGKKVSKRQAGIKEVLAAVDGDEVKADAVLNHLLAGTLTDKQAKALLKALRKRTAAIAAAAKQEAIDAGDADEEDFLDDYEEDGDELDGTELGNLLGAGAESVERYDALAAICKLVEQAAVQMATLVSRWGQTGDPHELEKVAEIQGYITDLEGAALAFTFEAVSK
jgi:ribosomal protein L12E/L44/L45/RPP1/RPP2